MNERGEAGCEYTTTSYMESVVNGLFSEGSIMFLKLQRLFLVHLHHSFLFSVSLSCHSCCCRFRGGLRGCVVWCGVVVMCGVA
jgi:hypothetical protein